MPASEDILDVTTATFEKEVVQRSRTAPVLVDFWAPWCGPCRTLSPVLEKLAREGAGSFALAKVDIDRSPELAEAFGVQSVPTVAMVKGGEIVDGFLGVQPEAKIREMLARHVGPARDPLAEALELEKAGKIDDAIALLRARTKAAHDDARARVELARLLALTGKLDEARKLFLKLSDAERESDAGQAVSALLSAQAHAGDLAPLEQAVAARPDDVEARLRLGRALLAARRMEEGVRELFEAARRDVAFAGGEPRKALIEAFAALGDDHALTKEYRRRLSLLLCS